MAREKVLIMHGILSSSIHMLLLGSALSRADFQVGMLDYAFARKPIKHLAETALKEALDKIEADKIHLVAHSMGGLVVRSYLESFDDPRLGHIVMLGTPHYGSEVADTLLSYEMTRPLYRLLLGPAGQELGTRAPFIPLIEDARRSRRYGIIAGKASGFHPFQKLLPKENDGLVSVASTRLEGEHEHRVMHVSHASMLWNPQVAENVAHYLRKGIFVPAS